MLIYTPSGLFDPLKPSPGEIHPRDIALGLSCAFRYGGLCRARPTVAQHCVEMSELAESAEMSAGAVRWCLMHDAAEAYLGDIRAQLRPGLCWLHGTRFTLFQHAEQTLLRCIAERFGLSPEIPPAVQLLDLAHRAAEVRDFLADHGTPADYGVAGIEPAIDRLPPRWPSDVAELHFLNRFRVLFGPLTHFTPGAGAETRPKPR